MHSIVSPAFAPANGKNMAGMVADEVMHFQDALTKCAESGEAFSMYEMASRLLFDVTSRTMFSYSLNAQTSGNQYLRDFKEVMRLVLIERETWNPVRRFWAIWKRKGIKRAMDTYIEERIRERFKALQEEDINVTKKQGLSILDLILRDRLEEAREMSRKSSKALDRDFMKLAVTNIKGLLFGGQGTTSDTLSFIYLLLSSHPDALQQLRAEHDCVFGPDATNVRSILQESPHKLNELEYTTAVINETLRMFPVGFSLRTDDASGNLTYNGRQYPTPSHMIAPLAHTMHYNPEIFPNPSKFEPERFLRENPVLRNAWRPFERGSRACLGQSLAIDELRIILLMTVRDFDFKGADIKPNLKPRCEWTDLDLKLGDQVFQEFGFEARPRDGMPMRVSKRSD